MESYLQKGARIRTTKHAGSTDWSDPNRPDAKWGAEGIIIGHSDSHGLIYQVQHDCGGIAWYESAELAPTVAKERELNKVDNPV